MRTLLSKAGIAFVLLLSACGPRPEVPAGSTITADSTDAALTELERRIVAEPGNAALYVDRARLRRAHGRNDAALEDLKRALSIDSTKAAYHLELGDLYYTSLKIKEAHASFSNALRLDPASDQARLKVAELELVAFKQYGKAVDLVNEVLRHDPNNAQAYFIKGWAYMENGDTARAISSFRTSVEQDPQHYQAWMELAELHAGRHDPLALQYFNTAIDLRPNAVEPLYGKGMYCQENGMDSLAMACYERIKHIEPTNALPWYNQGYIELELRDDPRAAIGPFTAAGKLLPSYYQAFYNRGLAYEKLGVLDSAAMDYQTALRIKPDFDPAANGMSRLASKGLRVVPNRK